VFSDVSLRHMARSYPADAATLMRVPGVGEKKLADFGEAMLQAITAWLTDHPRLDFPALLPAVAPSRRMQAEGALNGTAIATLERFRAGISIDEIARERSLTTTTIEGHLARAIADGEKLDPRTFYSAAEEAAMRTAFIDHEGLALKPVYEKLEGNIGYGKLRIFQAFEEVAAKPAGT
jgi:ATP-dependent DNA helicase RecQ